MPEPDYISKVYKALSENLDDFNFSEDEFREKMSSNAEYKANSFKALNDVLVDFPFSEDEHYKQIDVALKKKGSSVSSDTKLPYQKPVDVSQATPYGMPKETQIPFVSQGGKPDKTVVTAATKGEKIEPLSKIATDEEGIPQGLGYTYSKTEPEQLGIKEQQQLKQRQDIALQSSRQIFDKVLTNTNNVSEATEKAEKLLIKNNLGSEAGQIINEIQSEVISNEVQQVYQDPKQFINLVPSQEEEQKRELRIKGYSEGAVELAWENTKDIYKQRQAEIDREELQKPENYGGQPQLRRYLLNQFGFRNPEYIKQAFDNARFNELQKKDIHTPEETKEYSELFNKIQNSGTPEMFNIVTGERETPEYKQAVDTEINYLKQKVTTKELLSDEWELRGAAYVTAQKELNAFMQRQQRLAGQPIVGDYSLVNEQINKLQQNVKDAGIAFDAASRLYVLNESPSNIVVSKTKTFGQAVVGSFLGSIVPEASEAFLRGLNPSERQILSLQEKIMSQRDIKPTNEEKEKFEVSFGEGVAEMGGGLVGIMPKIMLYSYLFGMADVPQLINGGKIIYKGRQVILGGIKNPLLRLAANIVTEEAKMQMAGFNKGAGGGFAIAGEILPKTMVKLPGRLKLFQPLVNKVIPATLGGTLGMETAMPLEISADVAISNLFGDKKSFDYHFKQAYPSLEGVAERIGQELIVNAMLGGYHGITGTKGELEKSGMDIRDFFKPASKFYKASVEYAKASQEMRAEGKTKQADNLAELAEFARYKGDFLRKSAVAKMETIDRQISEQADFNGNPQLTTKEFAPFISEKAIKTLEKAKTEVVSKEELLDATQEYYNGIERINYLIGKATKSDVANGKITDFKDLQVEIWKEVRDIKQAQELLNTEKKVVVEAGEKPLPEIGKETAELKVEQSEPLSPKYEIEGKEYSKEEFITEINRRKEAGEDIKDFKVENDEVTLKETEQIFKPEITQPTAEVKPEINKVKDKPISTETLEDYKNKEVEYNGVKGILKIDEGGKVTIETANIIHEIQGTAKSNAAELGVKIEPIPKDKYEVDIKSETDVRVNGVDYKIITDNKGNIIGLDNRSNIIKNEAILIEVEKARNKELDNRILKDVENLQSDVRKINALSEKENVLIENILNNNMTEVIDIGISKLEKGEKLTTQEKLQIELWGMDAIERLSNVKGELSESGKNYIERLKEQIYDILKVNENENEKISTKVNGESIKPTTETTTIKKPRRKSQKAEIKPEGEVKTEKIEPVEPIKPKSNENITTEENPIVKPTIRTLADKTKTTKTIKEVERATAEADRLISESGANVSRLPINNIVVAPKVMQFKAADTKAGTNVNERIPDTEKYSESSAGVILVWKDAKNELGFGKDAIILVDGHHRMDFAKRKGQSEMNVLFVEANTAKEARLEGAFANIRQGRGTAIDAAKIYREASPEQIKTFKPTSLVARQGQQLANLAPELFELLTTGKLDIQRALAISEVKNTKDQVGLYRMVTSRKKKLTIDGIKAMANEINEGNVPKKKNVEETLFGTNETEEILLIEKANLIGKIKSELAKDAKILASANKNKEVLEKAGNVIAVEENVQLSQEAKVASGLFETFKNRKSVQDILTKATEDLSKAKESEKKAIREKALKKIKQAINKELDSAMGKQEVSKDKKADKTKVEKIEPLSETELANRRKAEKEYNTELEDLDTRIKQAERSKQLKLDDLNKKVDLFAGEGEIAEKGGGLFELPKKQQSPEDIAKILEPYTKEIERLKTKRQELINNKEKYLDKYKGQLETPDVTKTTTELGASNKRSFSNKTEPVTTKGKVKTFAEMAKSFIDGIKKPVRYIKPKRARTIGAYNPTNGLIVMKKANDILTLIHEAAHWLDDYYTLFKNNDKFDSELSKYWDRGSKPPANYPEAERYKRNEGFAEFMVDYIMRPEQTKKESPMLYQLFENTFKDVHKKAIEQLSIDVRNFANLPAIERIGANVQKIEPLSTSKKIKEKVKDFFNKEKFTTRWLNQFYPAEQAFKSLLEVNGISKIYGKKNFETMLKSFLGKDETFYQSLTKYGILGKNLKHAKDANGNPYTLNSLLDILTDNGKAGENVLNERLQIANNVQIAKRTVEIEGKLRQKQIIEDILSKENKLPPDNLITPEIASEYSKEIADKKAKNAAIYTNKRYDFTEAVISGTGGGIFKDYSEAKLALNEFELMKNTNPELFDIINKFNERQKEMSSLLLDYMVETELLTKEQAKAIKDNNLEYISFKRLKESEVGVIEEASLVSGSNPITSVKDIIKAVKGGSSTIQDPIASFIIDYHNIITQGAKNTMLRTITDLADNMRDMYEGKPSLISDILFEVPKGTKGAIRVVKNGEGKYYKFEKSIEESIETLSNMGFTLPGVLTFFPSLLRTAVTTSLQFLARNISRDNIERLFGSTEGKFKIPKNLKRAKQEYLLAGGGQFGFYAKNRTDYEAILTNAIKDVSKDNRNVIIKASLLIPKNVYKFYDYLRTNSETFTRVLEYDSNYKKFKDMGLSDVDAQLEAMAAGRRMMDFKVGGTHAKVVNQMLPFFNPSIQGTRRFYDRITKDPLKVVTRMLVYGGLFELAQAGIIKMSDDDKQKEYFGLSPYRKLLFYNIPLGDGWLIIPKGFTFGMLTSNIGRSLDRYWLGDKNAFDLDYLTKQIKLLNPVNSELITGIQNTFSGINSNYDAFRGKNIIPAYEKNKAVELRKGTEKASELSKFISKIFTKIDPRMTDYFIKSSLSYWGDMATSLSNIGTDKAKSLYLMTGFYKEKSIYSNQDVMYVLNTAEKFEQTADNNYKTLVEKIELYNETKSKSTKKDLFNKIIREAKTIREKWEGVDLLEKRKREKGKKKENGLPQ